MLAFLSGLLLVQTGLMGGENEKKQHNLFLTWENYLTT